MFKIYSLFGFIVLLLSSYGFAGQVKTVQHTMMVTVDLSSRDPNIISVANDRIKQYSALKGVLTASIDSELGVINIKPLTTYDNRPFTLFIFTEKGNRYSLLVNPKKIPAQDVVLENKALAASTDDGTAKLDAALMVNLIKHMQQDKNLSNYNKIDVSNNQDYRDYFNNRAELQLAKLYQGSVTSGEVITFRNITDKALTLTAAGFATPKVIAIALQDENLPPGATTTIYRVVNHG